MQQYLRAKKTTLLIIFTYFFAEIGGTGLWVGGLYMEYVELCQLAVVTQTGEGTAPKHITRYISNWRKNRKKNWKILVYKTINLSMVTFYYRKSRIFCV